MVNIMQINCKTTLHSRLVFIYVYLSINVRMKREYNNDICSPVAIANGVRSGVRNTRSSIYAKNPTLDLSTTTLEA